MFNPFDYFRTIAAELPELNADADKQNFFRVLHARDLVFNHEFLSKLEKAHSPALILEYSREGNFNAINRDKHFRSREGVFYLLTKANPAKENETEVLLKSLDELGEKVIARIEFDQRAGTVPKTMQLDFRIFSVGPLADYRVGFGFVFGYDDIFCKQHDPAAWNN